MGPWQRRLFALLWIPSATSAMAVFMYDFTAFVSDHRCMIPVCDKDNAQYDGGDFLNYSIPWDSDLGAISQCKQYAENQTASNCGPEVFDDKTVKDCTSWVFDHSLIESSAVEDFGMVCDDSWRKGMTQTVYMVGMLIGSFLFGWISDQIGRKPTLMIGLIVLAVGGSFPFFLTPHPDIYYSLVISRFISGMGHVGTFMMSFSLSLEYVGPSRRTLTGIIIETPFALGLLSWAGIRRWQTLSLVLSAPNLLLLCYWFILPESPRWLIAKNKTKELQKVLQSAAKTNKRSLPNLDSTEGIENVSSSATVLDLFRPRVILKRSLVMFLNWMVTTMCYYGLTSAAATLTPDLYVNFTLAIFVEIPAQFASLFLLDRWGRKPVLGGAQFLAGVTCIGAGLLSGQTNLRWLQITLALIGKFGATASFAVVFVYTAEMFPTEIRSTAVGASSLCGRVGGIVAPQVVLLGPVWEPLPLVIMGIGSLIGGILVFLVLPETLGSKLPDSMEEAQNLGKKRNDVQAQDNQGLEHDKGENSLGSKE